MNTKRFCYIIMILIISVITFMSGTSLASAYFNISNGYLYSFSGTDTSVTIPSNVTAIGAKAFYMKSDLRSVYIPSSVARIEKRAFYSTGLTYINIPSSVNYLGDYAFGSCIDATKLNISPGSSIETIPTGCFEFCSNLSTVYIPPCVKSIYSYAFGFCYDLSYCYIPKSVTYISPMAFDGCDMLTIHSTADSYAISYAKEKGIDYVITDASVHSVSTENNRYAIGEYINVTVKADASINKLWYKASDANYVAHTVSTSGGYKIWKYTFYYTEPGTYRLMFSGDSKSTSSNYKSVAVEVYGEESYSVISAEWDIDSVIKGETARATVCTGKYAYDLSMCLSNGTVVKKWLASEHSTLSGDQRIWKISHSFSGVGEREMLFISTYDGKLVGSGATATIKVAKPAYAVVSARFDNDSYAKGSTAKITVATGKDAKYLMMYAESGSLVKTWKADGNSNLSSDGSQRIWKVSHAFSGAGSRTMSFKASYDKKALSYAKKANALITSGNDINVSSAAFKYEYQQKGTAAVITVKTGADAKYLSMFVESGSKAKTWKASDNSKVSGNLRVWTVSHTFSGTGVRTMTFKGSKDAITYGTDKSDSILITSGSDINVRSAGFDADMAVIGNAVTVTVKTGADAKYLAMFTEKGAKAKIWKAASSSTLSGAVRIWKVSHTFSGAGYRKMTFGASKNNVDYGAGKTAELLVTSGNDIDVSSAQFAVDTVVKGEAVKITVKTGADAKYLGMFVESGSKAKTWKAADCSSVSGGKRVWIIYHTFSGVGSREMTFKASKDNSSFGNGRTDTLLVTAE